MGIYWNFVCMLDRNIDLPLQIFLNFIYLFFSIFFLILIYCNFVFIDSDCSECILNQGFFLYPLYSTFVSSPIPMTLKCNLNIKYLTSFVHTYICQLNADVKTNLIIIYFAFVIKFIPFASSENYAMRCCKDL